MTFSKWIPVCLLAISMTLPASFAEAKSSTQTGKRAAAEYLKANPKKKTASVAKKSKSKKQAAVQKKSQKKLAAAPKKSQKKLAALKKNQKREIASLKKSNKKLKKKR
jgi:hypothetical protein